MKAIGSEGNYEFIILCTEDLKTDISPDTEQTLVGIMKKSARAQNFQWA